MLQTLARKIFGSRNDRLVKQYRQRVAAINAHEPRLEKLTDTELSAKTAEFKDRVAKGEALDKLLPEAFAVVREASRRALGMRHYDVQLIGGMVQHDGKISEMRTGEGKTLVAPLAAYLNALTGKGVHVVTVNDYLAQRDADWMGRIYRFLGLTVGVNLSQMSHEEKQAAYAADITYGTNNEFGFDYLRDNMVFQLEEKVQRGLAFAIVDEVDSILIDEARTPLIISGQAEDSTELYTAINVIPPKLSRAAEEKGEGDYWVDEKAHSVLISETGHEKIEQLLTDMGLLPNGGSLYDAANIRLMHHVNAALRAFSVYHRDQHYVVQNGEVVIVDEFTGRLMSGRRWSEGLHQAVEAKEGVAIQKENQTLASITFQNYFRMYGKLAGMTGTADTEAYEFQSIYNLETVVIPTHRDMIRERPARPGISHHGGEIPGRHQRHSRLSSARPAGAGRHHLDRDQRVPLRPAEQGEAAAPGAERQAARKGSGDHRSGRRNRRRNDCHQHGGPRHGHRAGRQHPARTGRHRRRRQPEPDRKGSAKKQDQERVAAAP